VSGPVAGPIASRSASRFPRVQAGSGRVSAAQESPLGRPLRISATRLEYICSRLGDRDWEVLDFVSGCRLATGRQLVAGLHLTDRDSDPGRARVARKHLKRLADLRVIDPLPGRSVGGIRGGSDTLIYGVGVAGTRLLARRGLRQKRLGTPGARHIDHTLACTQVAVDLRLAAARGVLDLIEVQHEPQCWRSFIAGFGGVVTLKPDLYLRVARPGSVHEYRAMLEVDRATEAASTIRAKVERYLSHYRSGEELREHAVHPRVIWSVPDQSRAAQIQDVLDRLSADFAQLFAVCQAQDVSAFLRAETRP
jgi:hypothetical protein